MGVRLSAADAAELRALHDRVLARPPAEDKLASCYLAGARATVLYGLDPEKSPARHTLIVTHIDGRDPRPLIEAILDLWFYVPVQPIVAAARPEPGCRSALTAEWATRPLNR